MPEMVKFQQEGTVGPYFLLTELKVIEACWSIGEKFLVVARIGTSNL